MIVLIEHTVRALGASESLLSRLGFGKTVLGDDLVELGSDLRKGRESLDLLVPLVQLAQVVGQVSAVHFEHLLDFAEDDEVDDRKLIAGQVFVLVQFLV